MRARKIASVDQNTGEILQGVIVYCGVKQNPYSAGWVMNSQEALELLATDDDLKGEAYKVLLLLLARLDFENWIQIGQSEIAEKLNMKKQNVSRAILILEEKGIILRGSKLGRSYAFRLNPDYGWKGKVTNLDDYRQERDDREHKQQRKETLAKNFKVVELSKEDQLIQAIKAGKINVEKLYSWLNEEQD